MDALALLAVIAALAVVVTKIVEAIRRQFPGLEGTIVQVIALIIATGAAWYVDLDPTPIIADALGITPRPLPAFAGYFLGGAIIAATAGFFADRANSNKTIELELSEGIQVSS